MAATISSLVSVARFEREREREREKLCFHFVLFFFTPFSSHFVFRRGLASLGSPSRVMSVDDLLKRN